MRRMILPPMLFVALCASAPAIRAQLVDLTDDRTAEQKWQRAVYLLDWGWVVAIAHAKSMGQTPEQYGRFVGELAGPSWSAQTPAAFVRGVYRNYRLYDGLEFEILEEAETEIRARMNVPYKSRFGESGEMLGVTLQDYMRVYHVAYEEIADYLGFEMSHEHDGDWIIITVKRKS